MNQISQKTALVTGASRGIGRAIAKELAKQGAKRLLLVATNEDKLQQVAEEIEAIGVETAIIPVDLTDDAAVNIAIASAWRDYAPIEILVNCAGIAHQSPFLQSKSSHVEEEISLNLMGMYRITRLIAKRMAAQKRGIIINVSSLMGKIGAPTMATYSATKFAILGFTQALRGELAPYNIQVVALLPTLTRTDMTTNLTPFRWVSTVTPEQVAQNLIQGLQKHQTEILVGWQTYLAIWCQRLLPWLIEKIVVTAAPKRYVEKNYYPKVKRKLKQLFTAMTT